MLANRIFGCIIFEFHSPMSVLWAEASRQTLIVHVPFLSTCYTCFIVVIVYVDGRHVHVPTFKSSANGALCPSTGCHFFRTEATVTTGNKSFQVNRNLWILLVFSSKPIQTQRRQQAVTTAARRQKTQLLQIRQGCSRALIKHGFILRQTWSH